MTCTFFVHRTAPEDAEPILRSTLIDLIEHHNVNRFYVGHQGPFDGMTRKLLKELSNIYPICYHVVLSYLPVHRDALSYEDYSDTVLPDGIEAVPKRFAIDYRNRWMIQHSDYVVTYVTNHIGSGAAKYMAVAESRKRIVINIAKEAKKTV